MSKYLLTRPTIVSDLNPRKKIEYEMSQSANNSREKPQRKKIENEINPSANNSREKPETKTNEY